MRYYKYHPASVVLLPLLVLAGCSHTIPETTTRPQPPPQLGKTPPVIEPLHATRKQAQAPESLLPITLTADLTPVQRSIQAAIPARFTEEHHPLGADYRWRFLREGEPQVVIQDGLVTYQAVYRGEIESSAARACRLDPVYPVLEGTGKLTLRQQEEDLVVALTDTHTTLSVKPESDSKCNMFNLPVKDQLAELFKQEAVTQDIARAVERAGYKIPISFVWQRLHEPMAMTVAPANTQLCLYGRARDFSVGSLKGPGQQTTITGIARQTPVALYQSPCQKPSVPPMKINIGTTAALADEAQPYKVLLSVPVPYAFLNQQLRDRLFHQEAKLPTTFGDKVMLERATASDANGRTLIAVETSGDLNGTIYYWGTPRLEDNGNLLTIPDLQMATESKAALDGIKIGYWQLVDQQLAGRLREAATVDLSQRLGNMKSAVSGQHRSGGLALDLLVGRQEAAQVYSTHDALVADILLQGTASAMARLPVEQRANTASHETGTGAPQAVQIPEGSR